MLDKPTVTVVTPSYNQAPFLAEALGSVRTQSYPLIEHLVRDGGSTDGSVEILAAAGLPAPGRFDWRSGRDGGQAAAINQAIGEATGSIIAWVNSDDRLAPGAVARAVAHFRDHPDHLMVYGRAQWIDEAGRPVDWYPTQPPEGPPERFRDGCFLCQPTVFLRREAFAAVGLLDASLHAAHDFDLWIRLFKAAPGRIGFIDAEQAQSRLHAATKTLAGWDRAALEAMTVVRRHFGDVPAHWLLSAASECFARHPAADGAAGRGRARRLLRGALALLAPDALAEAKRRLRDDRRFGASGPGVAIAVTPDGWAGRHTEIRIRRDGHRTLVLQGRHAHPRGAAETLTLRRGAQSLGRLHLRGNGPFTWHVPLPAAADRGGLEHLDLMAGTTFVPAEIEPGAGDRRTLAVLIDKVWLA